MFTPNKRKTKTRQILCSSFEPSDFIQLEYDTHLTSRKQYKYADKENIAKEILIQIGQSQLPDDHKKISKTVPLPIDSWISGSNRIKNQYKCERPSDRKVNFARNVRSVTAGINKQKDFYEQNAMIKLKQALKKLESPEKNKQKQKKMRNKASKCEILESLLSKRRVQTKVSDLIKLKQCQTLKGNGSSNHFHTRKISSSMQNRPKKQNAILSYPQPLDARKMNELFNFNYKEARKNRTLKGLLS